MSSPCPVPVTITFICSKLSHYFMSSSRISESWKITLPSPHSSLFVTNSTDPGTSWLLHCIYWWGEESHHLNWCCNMRDPVTRCRGSLWVFPCEKIRAVLRLLIISNKFVRQSRHIGTLTKMVFVVWVSFSPHLLQDLFICKASLATLKRTTICPTTKVISDRQGKLFSFTFVGIST